MIKWPKKSVKFGQKAPFFMPQLKIKVDDLYQFHLFFKEGVVISNLIVFQEAVVISSYLNFNKTWKTCHFPINAHAKSAFLGYLNVIVCTAKTRSVTYWFFCLIWVRRWYTLQRSDLYTSVVIHKWDQHTSLILILSHKNCHAWSYTKTNMHQTAIYRTTNSYMFRLPGIPHRHGQNSIPYEIQK